MERATNDFIEANRDTIKCLSLHAADAAFSAAAALRSVGEDAPLSLWFIWDAMQASASVIGCLAPPREFFEETFEGENKHCQCAEVGGQLFLDWLDVNGNRTKLSNSELVEAKEIKDSAIADGIASCNWVTVDGEAKLATYDIQDGGQPLWYIVPTLNTGCCAGTPAPVAPQPLPPPYIFPVKGTSCTSSVQLIDSCVDRYGFSQNFYEVKENEGDCDENFKQYFYWESINGPYVYNSFGLRDTWWGLRCEPIYAPPHPHQMVPVSAGGGSSSLSAVTYTLDAGCTYNQETEDFDTKFTYDVEATSDGIVGLARRMDALAWMINNSGLIPYTTCARTKPVLEGDWVTLRFESDEPSPNSNRVVRKLLRYRSKSGAELGSITDYWRGFTWTTGPVIVTHADAWWGQPKCWAVSADEGKRVIRHAAGEAGIDPDQVGRWIISGSRDPRYGMSLPVKFAALDGGPWVTQREGPSGPAEINR